GDWAYGVPLSDVKRLVGRWRGGYDWRAHEREINEQLPMFTRDIELEDFGTVNVHYVHKRSPVAGAIPLLFVHGWPGSIIEMSKILPLLTAEEPGHPSFHVVAPSLPGYAWSEAILNPGFHGKNYAEYVTQGGDWGNVLTRALAARYGPKHVKACHTNMALYEQLSLSLSRKTMAYEKIHRATGWTRRRLAAWIYEKLVLWADDYPWTDDEGPRQPQMAVPLGISYFPKELARAPKTFIHAQSNVVFESEHAAGGHFAAYEKPEALVDDLRRMFGKDGGF
ncbi:Alpha/Beta hydrolase protein, partial [Gloeopeniophorella convolvens]